MTKKTKKCIVLLFVFFLAAAVYRDCSDQILQENMQLHREDEKGKEQEVQLILNVDGVLEEYVYDLELLPVTVSEEMAEGYFLQAIKQIKKDFETFDTKLPIQEKYAEGMVKAKWSFDHLDCVTLDGRLIQDAIPQEGIVVQAEVFLSCGEYEQIYGFSVLVEKAEVSEQEKLLQEIERDLQQQLELEGVEVVTLPTQINGVELEWSEKKDFLTLQVLLLEAAAMLGLWWGGKKQAEQEEEKRVRSFELDYPDIVNQISILLETGMSLRQLWGKIASQYELKRKLQLIDQRPAFEAIVSMNRRLEEGGNERLIYQKFADEVNVRCYHRLMRTLSSNMEKGSSGLCRQLTEECQQAYEQRILTAKRMGEEASTKMLIPLLCMMVLIMVIVLLPALLGTKI